MNDRRNGLLPVGKRVYTNPPPKFTGKIVTYFVMQTNPIDPPQIYAVVELDNSSAGYMKSKGNGNTAYISSMIVHASNLKSEVEDK